MGPKYHCGLKVPLRSLLCTPSCKVPLWINYIPGFPLKSVCRLIRRISCNDVGFLLVSGGDFLSAVLLSVTEEPLLLAKGNPLACLQSSPSLQSWRPACQRQNRIEHMLLGPPGPPWVCISLLDSSHGNAPTQGVGTSLALGQYLFMEMGSISNWGSESINMGRHSERSQSERSCWRTPPLLPPLLRVCCPAPSLIRTWDSSQPWGSMVRDVLPPYLPETVLLLSLFLQRC